MRLMILESTKHTPRIHIYFQNNFTQCYLCCKSDIVTATFVCVCTKTTRTLALKTVKILKEICIETNLLIPDI